MLANKIHPRDSYGTLSINKSIEDYRHVHNTENEERLHDKNRGGFKWDKTDSECKLLRSHIVCDVYCSLIFMLVTHFVSRFAVIVLEI